MVLFEILGGSESVQGVMRPEGVVDSLPVEQSSVEGRDIQFTIIEFIELFGMATLGSPRDP